MYLVVDPESRCNPPPRAVCLATWKLEAAADSKDRVHLHVSSHHPQRCCWLQSREIMDVVVVDGAAQAGDAPQYDLTPDLWGLVWQWLPEEGDKRNFAATCRYLDARPLRVLHRLQRAHVPHSSPSRTPLPCSQLALYAHTA